MQVTYGNFTLDTTTAPEASLRALLSRGMAHVLGNEARSKAINALRAANRPTNWDDMSKEAKDEWNKNFVLPDTESAEYIAAVNDAQSAMWTAILEGKLGESAARGPQRDPVDVEYERLLRDDVIAILKANRLHKGAKHPALDQVFKFPDGEATFETLMARRAARAEKGGGTVGDRLRKSAESIVKARAKALEKAKVAEGEPVDTESLGF
jgi:hypothetical protein